MQYFETVNHFTYWYPNYTPYYSQDSNLVGWDQKPISSFNNYGRSSVFTESSNTYNHYAVWCENKKSLAKENFIEISVPTHKVGSVLGPRGSTLKQIQKESGCKMLLFLEGSKVTEKEKLLRICGCKTNVEYAKEWVQNLLHDGHDRVEETKIAPNDVIICNNDQNTEQKHKNSTSRDHPTTTDGDEEAKNINNSEDAVKTDMIRNDSSADTTCSVDNGSIDPDGPEEHNKNLTEEIMVANNVIGSVIGKGGQFIRKVRDLSGATIDVDEDPPPDQVNPDHQRIITIKGTTEAVRKAADMIRELSESKFPHQTFIGQSPDDVTEDVMIPVDRIGLVLGANGVMIKSLQQQAGCKMFLFREGELTTASEKRLRISGHYGNVTYGKQLVEHLLATRDRDGNDGKEIPLKSKTPSLPSIPILVDLSCTLKPGHKIVILDIPSGLTGSMIGKRGENLKHITTEFGIRVQQDRTVPEGSSYSRFRLQGTDRMIEDTVSYLRKKLRNPSLSIKPEPAFVTKIQNPSPACIPTAVNHYAMLGPMPSSIPGSQPKPPSRQQQISQPSEMYNVQIGGAQGESYSADYDYTEAAWKMYYQLQQQYQAMSQCYASTS